MTTDNAPALLTPDQTAELIQTTPAVLATWRWRGDGPPFTRAGRSIRYPRHLLEQWLESRTVRPGGAMVAESVV